MLYILQFARLTLDMQLARRSKTSMGDNDNLSEIFYKNTYLALSIPSF